MSAIAILGAVLVILACVGLGVRRHRRARNGAQGLILRPGPNGEIVVPITAAFRGVGKNSFRPTLSILPHSIRFRVLGEEYWAFSELTRVSAGSTLFGASLTFACRHRGELRVHLATRELARQVLNLLPANVPLTRGTLAMRLRKP